MIVLVLVTHDPGCTFDPVSLADGIACECAAEISATTLGQFIEANDDDQGAIDAAEALLRGSRCELGGVGAAPRFTLWRLA